MAGDGRLAGIFTPHDGKCHLKSDSYDGTLFVSISSQSVEPHDATTSD